MSYTNGRVSPLNPSIPGTRFQPKQNAISFAQYLENSCAFSATLKASGSVPNRCSSVEMSSRASPIAAHSWASCFLPLYPLRSFSAASRLASLIQVASRMRKLLRSAMIQVYSSCGLAGIQGIPVIGLEVT